MKSLYTAAALSTLCLLPLSAQAKMTNFDAELSANIGFVSEYSFRGIAQSNENPAMQGGFDIVHSNGLYAGVWGSNVNFNDGDEAQLETDLYAGYSGMLGGLNYDIGVIYYAYPGADSNLNYDFWEGSLSLGYDFDSFATSVSVNYSPEYFGESGDALYYAAAVDVPLFSSVTLSGHVGYQTIDDEAAFFGTANPQDSYMDWSLGLGYSVSGFDLSLQYVDTDLDEPSECADGCDARVIFGVAKSF